MQQVVYLIHLEKKLGHSQHYLGYSERLNARIEHHQHGRGSVFLKAANEAGIPWELVRTWLNQNRAFERRLKNMKNAKMFCPICNPEKFSAHGNPKK